MPPFVIVILPILITFAVCKDSDTSVIATSVKKVDSTWKH